MLYVFFIEKTVWDDVPEEHPFKFLLNYIITH